MKRTLFAFLAFLFPWIIFLLEGNLGLAFFAMACQITLIGWMPMTMLAYKHRENIPFFQRQSSVKSKSKSKSKSE